MIQARGLTDDEKIALEKATNDLDKALEQLLHGRPKRERAACQSVDISSKSGPTPSSKTERSSSSQDA